MSNLSEIKESLRLRRKRINEIKKMKITDVQEKIKLITGLELKSEIDYENLEVLLIAYEELTS